MKFKQILLTAIKFILSLIFIIALILLGWSLLTSMIKVFGDYTSTVEPAIVVAIISGLGAIVVNAISKHSERKSELFSKAKDKMAPSYEEFLTAIASKDNEKIEKAFEQYESVIAVNSSDDTYKEFLALKEQYKANKSIDSKRFITALRKEMKVSNKSNSKK